MKSIVLVELYIFPVLNQLESDGSASFPSAGSSHCRATSKISLLKASIA